MIKENSTFHRAFARFSFLILGSEKNYTFCIALNALPTLVILARDVAQETACFAHDFNELQSKIQHFP